MTPVMVQGKVRAQPGGNFVGEAKFKLHFKSGGAIDFGQAMLKVGCFLFWFCALCFISMFGLYIFILNYSLLTVLEVILLRI